MQTFINNKCWASFCIFFDEKEIRRIPSIFDIENRIALILTFKTKRNQRPIIFYTHKVGAEAKFIHPWTQLSSAWHRRSCYCTALSKWKTKIIRRSSSRLQCWRTPYTITLVHNGSKAFRNKWHKNFDAFALLWHNFATRKNSIAVKDVVQLYKGFE